MSPVRPTGSPLPENRARQAILDHVRARPGATCSEAARVAGVEFGSALWHLRRLTRAGLVEGYAPRGGTAYFARGLGLGSEEKRRLVLLRRPGYAQMLQTLRDAPGASLAVVAWSLGVAKSTAARRAAILREAGLLPPLSHPERARPALAGSGARQMPFPGTRLHQARRVRRPTGERVRPDGLRRPAA